MLYSVLLVVSLALLGTLSAYVEGAVEAFRDARRLTVIALLKPDEWSPNPWSRDFTVVSPDIAFWWLLHSDMPYEPCTSSPFGCDVPLVAYAGRTLETEDQAQRERAMALLRHFIARGEPVNAMSRGMTALHEAVLANDLEYVDVLLRSGARLDALTDRPDRPSLHRLTPLQYCEKLESKCRGQWRTLCNKLASAGPASKP